MNHRLAGWAPAFTPQDVAALAAVTQGPVLLAGGAEVRAELSAFGAAGCGPDIAVGATDAADVVAAVRFAGAFDLPLTVLSPGHPAPALPTGGLAVTTSRMDQIHLDRNRRTAIVGAGALWSDVVARAAELGLAPLVPACPGLSVVGRAYGWTAGHLRSLQVVTPDGRFHHVTAASDPRLFRRLCGSEAGDVGLGVVTSMEFPLFR